MKTLESILDTSSNTTEDILYGEIAKCFTRNTDPAFIGRTAAALKKASGVKISGKKLTLHVKDFFIFHVDHADALLWKYIDTIEFISHSNSTDIQISTESVDNLTGGVSSAKNLIFKGQVKQIELYANQYANLNIESESDNLYIRTNARYDVFKNVTVDAKHFAIHVLDLRDAQYIKTNAKTLLCRTHSGDVENFLKSCPNNFNHLRMSPSLQRIEMQYWWSGEDNHTDVYEKRSGKWELITQGGVTHAKY